MKSALGVRWHPRKPAEATLRDFAEADIATREAANAISLPQLELRIRHGFTLAVK
jgi:hypothetical protein